MLPKLVNEQEVQEGKVPPPSRRQLGLGGRARTAKSPRGRAEEAAPADRGTGRRGHA